MSAVDRIDALEAMKLWYDNIFIRKISAVKTTTDYADNTLLTDKIISRHSLSESVVNMCGADEACKHILDTNIGFKVAYISPTMFDKNNLSDNEYQLGMSSYYCSVINEFGMEEVEYRYDEELPICTESKLYTINVLSYKRYDNGKSSIEDICRRIQHAYVIPAKFEADILIVNNWISTNSGPHIKQIAQTYGELLKQYHRMYKKVFYIVNKENELHIFIKVLFGRSHV